MPYGVLNTKRAGSWEGQEEEEYLFVCYVAIKSRDEVSWNSHIWVWASKGMKPSPAREKALIALRKLLISPRVNITRSLLFFGCHRWKLPKMDTCLQKIRVSVIVCQQKTYGTTCVTWVAHMNTYDALQKTFVNFLVGGLYALIFHLTFTEDSRLFAEGFYQSHGVQCVSLWVGWNISLF